LADAFDLEFDVVVAGGGSAGCVLATRLTEHTAINVCLVEGGHAIATRGSTFPWALASWCPIRR
jgi:choline dehydrogenase-like flavoprotein